MSDNLGKLPLVDIIQEKQEILDNELKSIKQKMKRLFWCFSFLVLLIAVAFFWAWEKDIVSDKEMAMIAFSLLLGSMYSLAIGLGAVSSSFISVLVVGSIFTFIFGYVFMPPFILGLVVSGLFTGSFVELIKLRAKILTIQEYLIKP